MNFGLYEYKENPQVTKAWELIKKGKRDKAKEIFKAEGCEDPEWEVAMIEGFIKFQEACNADRKRNSRVRSAASKSVPTNSNGQRRWSCRRRSND